MKGQAALEFLTTYGWALMAILAIVWAIAFFGVTNLGVFERNDCYFGSQLVCTDFLLQESKVSFILENSYGKDIIVEEIIDPRGEIDCPNVQTPIAKAESWEFICDIIPAFELGSYKLVALDTPVRKDTPGSLLHNVKGSISGEVQQD